MVIRRVNFTKLASTVLLATGVAAVGVVAQAPAAQAATAQVSVSTSAQLTAALRAAKPGQVINLKDGTYTGRFLATKSGTSSAPITLVGSRKAVLTTGTNRSAAGLVVTGKQWMLRGFTVTNSAKGIVLDNSDNTVIDGVAVTAIGQEGIHVRKSSNNVIVRNSVVNGTGLFIAGFGEGIYVGSGVGNWREVMGSKTTPDLSNNVLIENNRISNTTAEGIDIKEGTTGGRVTRNVFSNAGYSGANYADSWIDVKGNDYAIWDNSGSGTRLDAFQVHAPIAGSGGGNKFRNNTVTGGVPGHEVSVSSATPGNIVYCKPAKAARGLSNISCS
jgi:parallel beta-helix repeat protein